MHGAGIVISSARRLVAIGALATFVIPTGRTVLAVCPSPHATVTVATTRMLNPCSGPLTPQVGTTACRFDPAASMVESWG